MVLPRVATGDHSIPMVDDNGIPIGDYGIAMVNRGIALVDQGIATDNPWHSCG